MLNKVILKGNVGRAPKIFFVKPPEMGPLLVSSYKGYELTNAPSNSAVVSELIFFLFEQDKRRRREIP